MRSPDSARTTQSQRSTHLYFQHIFRIFQLHGILGKSDAVRIQRIVHRGKPALQTRRTSKGRAFSDAKGYDGRVTARCNLTRVSTNASLVTTTCDLADFDSSFPITRISFSSNSACFASHCRAMRSHSDTRRRVCLMALFSTSIFSFTLWITFF